MLMSLAGAPCAFRYVTGVEYARVPGPEWESRLYLDVLVPSPLPSSAVPAVVYLHGGGWAWGSRTHGWYPWLSPLLAAHGFVAVNVSYRLTGQAPFPAQLDDVRAAVRFLRSQAATYGIDPDRIGAWGDSAGGHLAALLGVSPSPDAAVQAVVARCAPADFEWALTDDHGQGEVLSALFGGQPAQRRELMRQAGPVHHVRPGAPPFLIVHGTEDETVPFASAEHFAGKLRESGADVTFHAMAGRYHNLQPDGEGEWPAEPWTELGKQALAFFDHHLRGR
ncbi:alpha/beta hydrolase fold domain-containing protein [Flindersiella endophytica]